MTPQALLGSILDGGASPSAAIGHKFADKKQQAVADAIGTLHATGKVVDALTVRERLKASGHDTRILSDLLDASANAYFEDGSYPLPVGECAAQSESGSRIIKAVGIAEFLAMQFPPRGNILAPWLPEQGLTMLFAPRGVGKTHLSLGIGYAVASGGEFLKWTAPAAKGVLLLDGEMPAGTLQERLSRLVVSYDKEPTAPLRIITPDLQPGGMIDLSNAADQEALETHLDGISLIICDNLSTLCRSGRENEAESWLPVQGWALRQRAAGRSVLFIHHSGKNGEQRGSSRREDVLDTVIRMNHPPDYSPDQGAYFEVHFTKARGLFGEDTKPFTAKLTTPGGIDSWTVQDLAQSTAEKVAELIAEGMRQADIAEYLGISKGAVSKAVKKAQSLGLTKVS